MHTCYIATGVVVAFLCGIVDVIALILHWLCHHRKSKQIDRHGRTRRRVEMRDETELIDSVDGDTPVALQDQVYKININNTLLLHTYGH